jgi:DNA polymerase III alpha subunit
VIPLFKTHASISRSILKNEDILDIQKEYSLERIVAVEDSFYGFRELNAKLLERKAQLIFGIRLPVVQNTNDDLSSKLVFFAKNNDGAKQIKKLYTKASCSDSGNLVLADLKEDEFSQTTVAVPFYDSFVYQNIFHFGMCEIDLRRFSHFFFEEYNDHPFDHMISAQLKEVAGKNILAAKSIYYRNREDITAFQFYKSTCSRSGGKPPSFGNPQLEHFCSAEFCWESYLEKTK